MGQLASNQQEISDVTSIIQMKPALESRVPETTDLLKPTDIAPISNPLPAIQSSAASAVQHLVEQVMASVTPLLQRELDSSMAKSLAQSSERTGLISIDVSPEFDIDMNTDMTGSFHDNNDAISETGSVTRTNGVQLDANFSNSMKHNNNAIGNGNVSRNNGLVTETEAENSASAIKSAIEGAIALGRILPREGLQDTAVRAAEAPAKKAVGYTRGVLGAPTNVAGYPATARAEAPANVATGYTSAVLEAPTNVAGYPATAFAGAPATVGGREIATGMPLSPLPPQNVQSLLQSQPPQPHEVSRISSHSAAAIGSPASISRIPVGTAVPQPPHDVARNSTHHHISAATDSPASTNRIPAGTAVPSVSTPSPTPPSPPLHSSPPSPPPEPMVTGKFLTIRVDPKINVHVDTNMSGAFFGNNNAKSAKGNVERVNGVGLDTDFSGALQHNNNAISNGTQNSVERFNGIKT
eukprot:TRINITY_DN19246_c0_g1_i1.p1 TRINITY_DN19246_c0_g1~~TRINITY_DN19246_c0_g1_i1.p1  ORF type:complete len:503 (-),score=54.89 TRINITY_DN19246_c0_g1_i1:102-1505(-)